MALSRALRERAGRIGQVVAVSARHGWRVLTRYAAESPRRGARLGALGRLVAWELREGLAELGPTFVKLGQVLSTRPDLVPPALEAALATLQDSAPTVSLEQVRACVAAALGSPPEAAFASFDAEPLAAASIGQVHAATLGDGRAVVVKVRRPGVVELVELDLSILRGLARMAAALPGPTRRVDLVGFVDEFAATIRQELDYLAEARNAERLAPELAALGVHAPKVVWSRTAASVLTLERIFGEKIDDIAALDAAGVDRPRLARTLAEAYLSMVFVHGFFHADPHPGNLFVEPGGRLAMVDFGMVGTVGPEVRHALVEILLALARRDSAGSAKALHELGVVPSDVDEQAFVVELDRFTGSTVEVPLRELRLAPLLTDLMAVGRRHRLHFPRELALLVKTVVMCEGLAAQLDPEFALALVIGPFVAAGLRPPDPAGGPA
jgi:ubiquinone biosynthesis protein